MIYTIATNDLKAVSLAMAKADIRYYLNGVLFELDNAEGYRLVATDGHRLHIVCKKKCTNTVHEIIMPSDIVKQLCKQKAQVFELEIIPGATRSIKIRTGGGFITVPGVEGKYPDYRRVMPKQLNPIETAHYQPEYLVDLAKAQKTLGTENQNGYLAQQGSAGGVYVDNEKSFYAVIMPMRHNVPEKADFELGLSKVQS